MPLHTSTGRGASFSAAREPQRPIQPCGRIELTPFSAEQRVGCLIIISAARRHIVATRGCQPPEEHEGCHLHRRGDQDGDPPHDLGSAGEQQDQHGADPQQRGAVSAADRHLV